MGWSVVRHRPYSPDLAPSDFNLFSALKNAFQSTTFSDTEEGKGANMAGVRGAPQTFLKCIPRDGSLSLYLFNLYKQINTVIKEA